MRKIKLLFALIFVFLYTCIDKTQSQSIEEIEFSYPKTIIPKDTSKLWVAEGNKEKDTVLIICQGGPKTTLDFLEKGRSSWRYLDNYSNYYKVHLHKASTLNTEMFKPKANFTIDMARKEVDNSSEILLRAITYFKEQSKTVYVLGHSYGTFIIQHYLATRESLADKYVLSAGRIEDPKHVVDAHTKGFNGKYINGNNFISEEDRDFSSYTAEEFKWYKTKQLLKAACGEISYFKALKDVDLKNSIYVYSSKDQRVGGLTQKELVFLRDKEIQVYETRHEEHGKILWGVIDGIKEGKLKF